MSSNRKTIFITGAAGGIGLASAKLFAARGWFVGLADIDQTGLARALAEIGPAKGAAIVLDVRDRPGWERALAGFAAAGGGKLDALVNNAGLARYGRFETISPQDEDLLVDVNLKGVLNGARAALPWLKASSGVLVNMSSCAGLYGAPGLALYAATKSAVRGLSEALDAEFASHGVRVRCVAPWFIDTPILAVGGDGVAALRAAGLKVYPVETAANAVWAAVHGRRLLYPAGGQARLLDLAARLLPALVRKRMKATRA